MGAWGTGIMDSDCACDCLYVIQRDLAGMNDDAPSFREPEFKGFLETHGHVINEKLPEVPKHQFYKFNFIWAFSLHSHGFKVPVAIRSKAIAEINEEIQENTGFDGYIEVLRKFERVLKTEDSADESLEALNYRLEQNQKEIERLLAVQVELKQKLVEASKHGFQ